VSKSSAASGGQGKSRRERLIETVAVILLGVATVGSAFCGYEATQWNGEEARLVRQASTDHVESNRLFGLATQIIAYDTNIVAQYAQAAAAKNEPLKEFYRKSLVRPAFLPILDDWEAQVASGVLPTNLLEDQEYLDEQFADYRKVDAAAVTATAAGEEAGNNADEFVLTAIFLAVGLFFAGVTSSFRYPLARYTLLAAAALTVAYSATRLVDLPIL
jgi:hypothetical protein